MTAEIMHTIIHDEVIEDAVTLELQSRTAIEFLKEQVEQIEWMYFTVAELKPNPQSRLTEQEKTGNTLRYDHYCSMIKDNNGVINSTKQLYPLLTEQEAESAFNDIFLAKKALFPALPNGCCPLLIAESTNRLARKAICYRANELSKGAMPVPILLRHCNELEELIISAVVNSNITIQSPNESEHRVLTSRNNPGEAHPIIERINEYLKNFKKYTP